MKNKLKFRCFCSTDDGQEMVYFGKVECDNGLWFDAPKHIDEYLSPPLQFIGIKDKNKKDIYVGDIVKWDDNSNGKYWRVAKVVMNPDIQFIIIKNSLHPLSTRFPDVFRFGNFIYSDGKSLEIVGNIYQNKNILKQYK